VAVSAVHTLKLYFGRNERSLAAVFLVAGFVFDLLTFGRIDSWHAIGQQALYLAAITLVLMDCFRGGMNRGQSPILQGKLAAWYYEWRMPAAHFLLGALLNLYTIFFFKSSSLSVSLAFIAFLVVLLLANESARFRSFGLAFKFAMLSLCFLSFFAYVIPVFTGSIGLLPFLAAMAIGCLPLAIAAAWARRAAPHLVAQARRQILVPLGVVLLGFLVLYLFRVIPPVPLSIPFIGVYHDVEKTDAGYRLEHERPDWRVWHNGDQDFAAQPGDKVYVYFRVFSPARFSDEVRMRWYWKDRGWALQDTIPIRIVGGREEGFRGYGVKSNYQPGEWKVEVETVDGREIGRIYFDLVLAPEAPRAFEAVFD
jgi:Protein of unknown function (DUF2914)